MKFQIIINGKTENRDITINWDGVSFRKCLELREVKNDNVTKILSILLDIDEATIRRSKIVNFAEVESKLSFMSKQMEYIWPSTILGHKVPKLLEFETTGQYEDSKLLLKNFPTKPEEITTEHFKSYVDLIAIYIMPNYVDSTEEEKTKFASQFWDAPCSEVLAIGNFTFLKYIGSIVHINPSSHLLSTPIRKFRLVIKVWLKRMAFSVRYFMWSRKLRSIEKNFSGGL